MIISRPNSEPMSFTYGFPGLRSNSRLLGARLTTASSGISWAHAVGRILGSQASIGSGLGGPNPGVRKPAGLYERCVWAAWPSPLLCASVSCASVSCIRHLAVWPPQSLREAIKHFGRTCSPGPSLRGCPSGAKDVSRRSGDTGLRPTSLASPGA